MFNSVFSFMFHEILTLFNEAVLIYPPTTFSTIQLALKTSYLLWFQNKIHHYYSSIYNTTEISQHST